MAIQPSNMKMEKFIYYSFNNHVKDGDREMMKESEKDIEKWSDLNVKAGQESEDHGEMVIYQFMSFLEDKTINIKFTMLQYRKENRAQNIPVTSFPE